MIQESALFYDRIVPYCKFQDFFVEYIYEGKNEKFHVKYVLKLHVLVEADCWDSSILPFTADNDHTC